MRRFIGFRVARDGFRIVLEFRANAFLYHMVRNMVGVLVEIGKGGADPLWAQELLFGRDRNKAAMTAPAQGLTLTGIAYPPVFGLPEAQS